MWMKQMYVKQRKHIFTPAGCLGALKRGGGTLCEKIGGPPKEISCTEDTLVGAALGITNGGRDEGWLTEAIFDEGGTGRLDDEKDDLCWGGCSTGGGVARRWSALKFKPGIWGGSILFEGFARRLASSSEVSEYSGGNNYACNAVGNKKNNAYNLTNKEFKFLMIFKSNKIIIKSSCKQNSLKFMCTFDLDTSSTC